MQLPLLLFLKDSREVRLFSELAELESAIEAIDVINGEYEAFDAQGRRVNLFVDQYEAPRVELGGLEPDAASALILSYYGADNPAFRPTFDLEELVHALVGIYGYRQSETSQGQQG